MNNEINDWFLYNIPHKIYQDLKHLNDPARENWWLDLVSGVC